LARYGPWAVVAGASEGLGEQFARALARRGLKLLLLARRADRLEALADDLRQEGAEVRTQSIDLGAPEFRERLQTACEGLEVGLLVYNAAYAPIGEFCELAPEQLLQVVNVNVRAPLVLAHALGRPMKQRGRGGIVLMSSLAGFQGTPHLSSYAASKAFNTVLAEGLWDELRGAGVDVLASCAGAIRTPGYDSARQEEAPGTLDAAVVAEHALAHLGRGPRAVPGFINKLASLLVGRLLPRRLAVAIMAASTRELS
jgi:short-subunit dehydrogenase